MGSRKHNTDILDGKGTFHGIDIIACSISNKDILDKRVKRTPAILKREAIEKKDAIKPH